MGFLSRRGCGSTGRHPAERPWPRRRGPAPGNGAVMLAGDLAPSPDSLPCPLPKSLLRRARGSSSSPADHERGVR